VQRFQTDRGQALPLLLLVLAVALVAAVAVGRAGAAAGEAARARTAADAAALAGAAEGRSEAARLATANGGELVSYVATGVAVEVVVRVGIAEERARAEQTLVWILQDTAG